MQIDKDLYWTKTKGQMGNLVDAMKPLIHVNLVLIISIYGLDYSLHLFVLNMLQICVPASERRVVMK